MNGSRTENTMTKKDKQRSTKQKTKDRATRNTLKLEMNSCAPEG